MLLSCSFQNANLAPDANAVTTIHLRILSFDPAEDFFQKAFKQGVDAVSHAYRRSPVPMIYLSEQPRDSAHTFPYLLVCLPFQLKIMLRICNV